MSNIIMLYTDDFKELDGTFYEIFINGKYIGSIGNSIYVLNKIFEEIEIDSIIIEKINLDTYLTREEREEFYLNQFCYLTIDEQEAILRGEIDYAFDMVKNRLAEEKKND